MKRIQSINYFFLLLFISIFIGCDSSEVSKKKIPKNRYEAFWTWFELYENEYFTYEKNQAKLFDSLDKKLNAIHPNITFVFTEVNDEGKRNFIVTADGNKEAFIDVRELVRFAPKLKKWNIIAFRPRLEPLVSIAYEGLILEPDDIMLKYQLNNETKLLDLTFYIKYYNEKDNRFKGAILQMLDNALGESDVVTKIGGIELKKFIYHNNNKNLIPIKELSKIVDSQFD